VTVIAGVAVVRKDNPLTRVRRDSRKARALRAKTGHRVHVRPVKNNRKAHVRQDRISNLAVTVPP